MSKPGAVLAGRIISELKELAMLVERSKQGWKLSLEQHNDYYLDSVALNLHGFYSSLERIFERVAMLVDESLPTGANWHQELLNQMSIEVAGLRPAVISTELKESLEDYRGFRHVVRNVYTYHFNPEKLKILVENLQDVSARVNSELSAFAEFLKNVK